MSGYAYALVLCLALILLLLHLLRARRIREKYAALWIGLAVTVLVLGAFPDIVFWLADLAGVATPVNLLFATAATVLLAVCLQMSGELSKLEEETRTLTEEVAILGLQVRELDERYRRRGDPEHVPGDDD